MARIYLDEGIATVTDVRLGRLGDDVVDARSIVLHSTSDHHHLAVATLLNRVLVTYNETDFTLLHHAWRDWFDQFGQHPPPVHAGVIVMPQPPALASDRAADLIHSFLNDPATGSLASRYVIWSARQSWEEVWPAAPWPPQSNTARRPSLATPPEIAHYLRRPPGQN